MTRSALDTALRYAAWATLTAGGPRLHARRHAVPGAAHDRLRSIWCRSRPIERDGVTMLRLPEHDWRAPRRLRADRSPA